MGRMNCMYGIQSPAAQAQFDHPGYYNSCTMKSCCFGGQDDQFVMSGSDDFNVYIWPIPEEGMRGAGCPGPHMSLRDIGVLSIR